MSSLFSNRIISNIFSITGGRVFTLLLNLLWVTLVARYLGVEDWGKFNYLLAVVIIVSKLTDFGFAPIVFRELSISKKSSELLNTAIIFRFIIFGVILTLFIIVSRLFNFTWYEVFLSSLLLVNAIISAKFLNIRELLEIPFKVELQMHFPMVFNIIDNLILVFFIILLPFVEGGLFYFVMAYTISNIPGFIFILIYLKKKYNFTIKLNLFRLGYLTKTSLPMFGFVLFDVLFQYIDVLFLKYFYSEYEIGIYSTAMRLVLPLLIIPSAIIHTAFPLISKNHGLNNEKTQKTINIVYKLLFLFGYVIAVLITFKSEEIVLLLFGENYILSATPMVILFWGQVFFYYNFFTINLFVVYNKQSWSFIYSIALLLSICILGFLLTPEYSIYGISTAKSVTYFLGMVLLFSIHHFLIKRKMELNLSLFLWAALLIMISFLLKEVWIFIYLPLMITLIFLLTVFLRYFSKEEFLFILNLINKDSWSKYLKFY